MKQCNYLSATFNSTLVKERMVSTYARRTRGAEVSPVVLLGQALPSRPLKPSRFHRE